MLYLYQQEILHENIIFSSFILFMIFLLQYVCPAEIGKEPSAIHMKCWCSVLYSIINYISSHILGHNVSKTYTFSFLSKICLKNSALTCLHLCRLLFFRLYARLDPGQSLTSSVQYARTLCDGLGKFIYAAAERQPTHWSFLFTLTFNNVLKSNRS